VIYDSVHGNFFVSVPKENTIYVTAAATGALVGKVWAPSAFDMALSSDGSRLYVTGSPQTTEAAGVEGITVVDTAKLHVVDFIQPTVMPSLFSTGEPTGVQHLVPRWIAAMGDGSLLTVANNPGISGGTLLRYTPSSGIATPPSNFALSNGTVTSSRDGSVAVAGGCCNIGVFTPGSSSSVGTITPSTMGEMALSPDGSLLLLGGRYLYSTQSFTFKADLQPSMGANAVTPSDAAAFSPDGTKIYALIGLPQSSSPGAGVNPVVAVYSAKATQLIGYVPVPSGTTQILDFQPYGALAADDAGHVVIATTILQGGDGVPTSLGYLELDASHPLTSLDATQTQTLGSLSQTAGSPSAPASLTISGSGFRSGAQVYFGQTAATTTFVSSTQLNVQPPPGLSGRVDVSIAFPDGWTLLARQAYSYGPIVIHQSITAGDVAGGTSVTLLGFGINGAGSGGYPTVLVGGSSATVTNYNAIGFQPSVTFTTPAGSVGPADIQLTGQYGSITLPHAFEYLQERVVGSLQPLAMVVDSARNKLYVADGASGSVVAADNTTLTTKTLFSSPNGPASALAMTPDGSRLVVLSDSGFTMDVVDLNTGADLLTTFPVPNDVGGRYAPEYVATTSRGTAIVSSYDTATYLQGATYEVNLTTGVSYPLHVQGDASTEPNVLAGSADGSLVYMTLDGSLQSSNGPLELWGATTDSSVACCGMGDEEELSTDDLGDRVLAYNYTFDQKLRLVTSPDLDSQTSTNDLFNQVYGQTLHSGGGLIYRPFKNEIRILDTNHGNVDLSVGDPNSSLGGPQNLAVSHDGSRIYVADSKGLRVIELPTVPLSIGSLTPAVGPATGGTAVLLRGSGFTTGTTVAIDGKSAQVQFVDATKLEIVSPAVTAAKDAMTVANPDGTSYTLDTAFDASPLAATETPPVLSRISPVSGFTGQDISVQVYGSGFGSDTVVYLDSTPAETLYVSPTQVQASFFRLPGPETAQITAVNGNSAQSNAVTLSIANSYLAGISLQPSSVQAGSGAFSLEVTGAPPTVFSPTSVVQWNGTALTTTYLSGRILLAQVPASDVAAVGAANITVVTPQALYGQGTSNAAMFTIAAPAPVLQLKTTSLTLGPVLSGTSASGTITVLSAGNAPLTVSAVGIPASAGQVTVANNCSGIVAPGQTCTIGVTWNPPAAGSGSFQQGGLLTLTSNGGTATVNFAGTTGNLVMSLNGSPATVQQGKSTTVSLSAISYGYISPATMTLSCSGLPDGASCSFSPATWPLVAATPGTNNSVTSTVTITTAAPTMARRDGAGRQVVLSCVTVLLCFCLRSRKSFMVGLASVLVLTVVSCSAGGGGIGSGGGSGSGSGGGTPLGGTPKGTYTISITAKAAEGSSLSTLTLTVN
jgi:sugar lactone lactonase YvrE